MSNMAQVPNGGRSGSENEGMAMANGRNNGSDGSSGSGRDSGNGGGARGALIGNRPIQGSQFSSGSQSSRDSGAKLSRSYKEMVEVVKKLHKQAGNMEEKVCQAYSQFADLTLKAASLFDPEVVQILSDDYKEIGGVEDPEEVHFTRQSVDDAYIELSQISPERGGKENDSYYSVRRY